ncbi:hypothetical protein LINPERHAP2_LOCUS3429, partial [Linum perenne]
ASAAGWVGAADKQRTGINNYGKLRFSHCFLHYRQFDYLILKITFSVTIFYVVDIVGIIFELYKRVIG